MEGWPLIKLHEAVNAVSTGPFGSLLHEKDYVENGIPLINPANIVDGQIIADIRKTVDAATADRLSAYRLSENDVIIGRRGEIGRCAVVESNHSGWLCGTGSFFIRTSPRINAYYLAYLLRSPAYREQLEQASTGATMKNLSNQALRNLAIPLPSLQIQKRIVAFLDEAFEGIDRAIANTEKNLANARELFKSVLAHEMSSSAGWEAQKLEAVVTSDCSLSYGIVQPGDEVDAGLPIVRPTDLTSKEINLVGLKRIDPVRADGYKRTTLQGGELLLCVRGSTGVVAVATKELRGANVTRGIVPIRFDTSRILPDFGYYAMLSDPVQRQIQAATYGAALMQINIRDLRNLEIRFPPLNQQRKMAERLDRLGDETACLADSYRAQLDQLYELKSSVLATAFAGNLRASAVAEVAA